MDYDRLTREEAALLIGTAGDVAALDRVAARYEVCMAIMDNPPGRTRRIIVAANPEAHPQLLLAIAVSGDPVWKITTPQLAGNPSLPAAAVSTLLNGSNAQTRRILIQNQELSAASQREVLFNGSLEERALLARYQHLTLEAENALLHSASLEVRSNLLYQTTPSIRAKLAQDPSLEIRTQAIRATKYLQTQENLNTLDTRWEIDMPVSDPATALAFYRDHQRDARSGCDDLQVVSTNLAPIKDGLLLRQPGNPALAKEISDWPVAMRIVGPFRQSGYEHAQYPLTHRTFKQDRLHSFEHLLWREQGKPWYFWTALKSESLKVRMLKGQVNLPQNADGWVYIDHRTDGSNCLAGMISRGDGLLHQWIAPIVDRQTPVTSLNISAFYPQPDLGMDPFRATLLATAIHQQTVFALWGKPGDVLPLGWTVETTANLPSSRLLRPCQIIGRDQSERKATLDQIPNLLRTFRARSLQL